MNTIIDITETDKQIFSHISQNARCIMAIIPEFAGFMPVLYYARRGCDEQFKKNLFIFEETKGAAITPGFKNALMEFYVKNIWKESFTKTFLLFDFRYDGVAYLIRDYEETRSGRFSTGFVTIKKAAGAL